MFPILHPVSMIETSTVLVDSGMDIMLWNGSLLRVEERVKVYEAEDSDACKQICYIVLAGKLRCLQDSHRLQTT